MEWKILAVASLVIVSLLVSPVIAQATTISIEDVQVAPGGSATVPIYIYDVTDPDGVGTVQLKLLYNSSVVQITGTDDSNSDFDFVTANVDNTVGILSVGGSYVGQAPGPTGDVRVIDVTFTAVGSAGKESLLNLTDTLLMDATVDQNDIPHDVDEGTFNITGVAAPHLVTYTISNNTIIPSQTTEIDVEFSEVVAWSIAIEGSEIYNWSGTDTDPDPVIWNGTYEVNGTQVPYGDYYVNVTGSNTTTGKSVINNTEIITVASELPPDETAPTTEVTIPPDITTPIPSGTTVVTGSPVMLSFRRFDNGGGNITGVAHTNYSMTGATILDWTTEPGEADFNASVEIAAEGDTTVWYYSVDNADNNESDELGYVPNVTVRIDLTPPMITAINATDITANSVQIVWNTSEDPSDSLVKYNESGDTTILEEYDSSYVTEHSISLQGLKPNTTYDYKVNSTDKAGNANESDWYNFTTPPPPPPELKNIRIRPFTATLNVTETEVFTATAYDQYGDPMSGINITWMVIKTTVGTVSPSWNITDENGTTTTTFTALAEGTALILAGNDAIELWKWGYAYVNVTAVPSELANIRIRPFTATLNVTETEVFTATAYDQYGDPMSGINITWTSDNETVGTVSPSWNITDENGTTTTTFTALAEGTALILAGNASISAGKWGYAHANVTAAPVPAPSITSWAPVEAIVTNIAGESRTFNITVDQVVNVSWQINGSEISNESGVTESEYTNESAELGYWNVSAIVENVNGMDMHTWMWNVYEPEVSTITVSPGFATLKVNETQLFTATAYDQYDVPMAGINITWASSNENAGTVSPSWCITDENGNATTTFTANAKGMTTITANNGTVSDTALVRVYEPEVSTITVSPSTAALKVNESQLFTATVYDQYDVPMKGTNITWSVIPTRGTFSPSWDITDSSGNATTTFTATELGPAAIRAANVTVGTAVVVVYEPELNTIEVEPSLVPAGGSSVLTATAYDQNDKPMEGINITWGVVPDTTVGTVSPSWSITDENGNATTTFTANATGITLVVAGKKTGLVKWVLGWAFVAVYEPEVKTIEVEPLTANLTVGETRLFTATAKDQHGKPMTDPVFTWSVSNPTVGNVSTDGLFTALEPGFTFVNATADNVTGSASVEVGEYRVDIWVDGATAQTIDKGDMATYTLKVKNTGTEWDQIQVGVTAGIGSVDVTTVSLNPGDLPAIVTLTVPGDNTGTFDTTVTATSVGDSSKSDSVTVTTKVESKGGPSGGGGPSRDSDGDGYSDVQEMIADTDENDPCDPDPECAACLALKPAATPTPTPTVTPTPTIPPVVTTPTPTPTPTPEEPGFEAVFAIAGLLAVAYLVLRRKRK